MIIYRCGRAIKDINELVDGNLYCFTSGFGGTLKIECGNYIFTASKEGVVLVLDEDAVKTRIQFKMLRKGYAENKVRKSTIEKWF